MKKNVWVDWTIMLAIAAAQATYLLLISALCHYSETNGSGCHVEAESFGQTGASVW